jgi:hypothetical protein
MKVDVCKWPWSTWFRARATNAAVGGIAVAVSTGAGCSCAGLDSLEEGGGAFPLDASSGSRYDGSIAKDASSSARSPTCPEPVESPAGPSWKAPAAGTQGACSPSDIAAIDEKVNDVTATFTDIFHAIANDTCRQCVFSSLADPTWQPLVWDPDMASGTAFLNYGACYALAPGGSSACGAAMQEEQFCLDAACPDPDCTTQGNCASIAEQGECSVTSAAFASTCGAAPSKLDAACAKVTDVVNVACGAPTLEGGTDAAVDAD